MQARLRVPTPGSSQEGDESLESSAIRRCPGGRLNRHGFALLGVLVVLACLYLGATGLFLAARSELRMALSHTASSRAFWLAEAGLATWLASPVQPLAVQYDFSGDTVVVTAQALLRADSVTRVYLVSARARVGGNGPADPSTARRAVHVLGLRTRMEPVVARAGSWREIQ